MGDLQNAKKYAVRRKRHSIWRNVVTCFAALVVFCTTYALILPAITMEFSCGKEEHVHADGCYTLSCGLEQTPGHFHDESCYDEEGKLTCGQEEPQSHTHTEACYAPADPTVPTDPICGLEETTGHTHDLATCYAVPKVLTCGQQEAAAHTHDPAACYTQQTDLTCGQEESGEHTHMDACYITSSVLTCTLPETEGHTHADVCYTLGDTPELVCTQEETAGHTHTQECYPADAQPQLICGKEELEVHKHTDECYTLSCVLEEHTHTNECQVKKDEIPKEEIPTDASLEEVDLLADGAAPRATSADFTKYVNINESQCTTKYIVKDKKYETKIYFEYGTKTVLTGKDLRDAGGKFYIDLSNENIQVEYNKPFDIYSRDTTIGKTGTFQFVEGPNGHPKMEITFSERILNEKKADGTFLVPDDSPVAGYLFFTGEVDGSETEKDNSLEVKLTDDLKIHFSENEIVEDTQGAVNYDLNVTKSKSDPLITYPDGTKDPMSGGTAKLTYTVKVASTNGTPGPINLKDHLTWQQAEGADKKCDLTSFEVVKVSNGSSTPVDVTKPVQPEDGKVRDWELDLPQLGAGEYYEVKYTYNYAFPADDKISVNQIKNDVDAKSDREGGRPEETVTGHDEEIIDTITPPSPDPSLKKTGALNEANRTVDWTVTYNADGKNFGGDKQETLVITDEKFKDAQGGVKVQLGGTELAANQYTVEGDKLTIQTPNVSNEKITITYSTPFGDLDKWTHGEAVTEVTNTASYEGFFNEKHESTDTVEKKGGDVQKSAGSIVDTGEQFIIPWQVTITPGSNGIPVNTVFDDQLGGTNHHVDFSSFKVQYAKADGTILGDVSCASQPEKYNQDWEADKFRFTFTENPFDKEKVTVPEGAEKIIVSYETKTTDGIPDSSQDFSNTTDVDGKKREDKAHYDAPNVNPEKTGTLQKVGPEDTGLTMSWTAKYQLNSTHIITSPITDTLQGGGTHYFDKQSLKVYYIRNNVQVEADASQFDVAFYETPPANTQTGAGTGLDAEKSTFVSITYKNLPYTFDEGVTDIILEYTTKTDSIPADHTDYKNKVSAFHKDKEATIPYDPPGNVTKTVGEYTVSGDTVTIPWNVTVETDKGQISTPITDSLLTATNTKNHYFPENPGVQLNVLDEAGNVVSELSPIDPNLYTVTYYTGYAADSSPEAGTGEGEGSRSGTTDPDAPKTYMVIRFNDTPYTIPGDYKSLGLRYNTVASLDPTKEETFLNQVWVNKKHAQAEETITPTPPTVEVKEVSKDKKIEQVGNEVRIPWTVLIKRGAAPLQKIEEQVFNGWQGSTPYANHYFDIDSFKYEFLDAAKNFVSDGNEADTVTGFSGMWDTNAFTPDPGTAGQEKPVFVRLEFTENAFKNAPPEVEYLKLTYYTYCPDIMQEQYSKFLNKVKVSDQVFPAETGVTKVLKQAGRDPNGNWTNDTVDVGENNGQLHNWQIEATTSTARTSLTIKDVLPQYVKLTGINAGIGGTGFWVNKGNISDVLVDETLQNDPYKFEVKYRKNEQGLYEVSVRFSRTDGQKIPENTQLYLQLIPVVDVPSLPASLTAKQITFTNTAEVIHDGGVVKSNPSAQTWTDSRDDVAKDALAKGRYYAPSDNMESGSTEISKGQWALRYYVDINPEGKDVEPDGNNFVLVDTLTYDSASATNVQGLGKNQTLNSFDIRLDTSAQFKLRVYKAVLNADGTVQKVNGRMVKGEELSPSDWAMTVDTQKEGTVVNKIIRASLPDATPLVMEYSYNVEPNLTPEGSGTVTFDYEASNKVVMIGHKRVESFDTNTQKSWESAKGGGSSGSKHNSFTIRKVDAGNNALMLSGATFQVSRLLADGTWDPVPVKVLQTDSSGTLEISAEYVGIEGAADADHWLRYNTLYKIVETAAPTGYVLPENPKEFFFYISSATEGTPLDATITEGATDLAEEANVVWVSNNNASANFNVEKIWKNADGVTIPGDTEVKFTLTQYESSQQPATSGTNDPLANTRTMKVDVKAGGKSKLYTIDVPKGARVKLTITNIDSSTWGWWLNNFDPSLNPLGCVPQQDGQTLTYDFTVNDITLATTNNFNVSHDKLDVKLTQVVSGSDLPSDAKVKQTWDLTLSKGNNYKWNSLKPGAGINGDKPLPYKGTNDQGQTVYYSYVVQEKDNGMGYKVTYSNVGSDGRFIPVSSGTIRVVNTRLENPPISLPSTGGIGTTVFTLAGLALTSGAGLGLCKTKAKRKRGKFEKE